MENCWHYYTALLFNTQDLFTTQGMSGPGLSSLDLMQTTLVLSSITHRGSLLTYLSLHKGYSQRGFPFIHTVSIMLGSLCMSDVSIRRLRDHRIIDALAHLAHLQVFLQKAAFSSAQCVPSFTNCFYSILDHQLEIFQSHIA